MSNPVVTKGGGTGSQEVQPVTPPVAEPVVAKTASVQADGPPSSAAGPSVEGTALWLSVGDRIVVWLLVAALLGLLGVHWLRLSRWGTAPVELSSREPREYYYSLDINSASWVEWAQLDGIGETLARRIIADREERGPFRNPKDVGRVRGIGLKLLERIEPFLRGGIDVKKDETEPQRVLE
jgi:competence protein ComEA